MNCVATVDFPLPAGPVTSQMLWWWVLRRLPVGALTAEALPLGRPMGAGRAALAAAGMAWREAVDMLVGDGGA